MHWAGKISAEAAQRSRAWVTVGSESSSPPQLPWRPVSSLPD